MAPGERSITLGVKMDPPLAIRSTITAIRSGAKAKILLPSLPLGLEPIDPRVHQPYRDIDEKAMSVLARPSGSWNVDLG